MPAGCWGYSGVSLVAGFSDFRSYRVGTAYLNPEIGALALGVRVDSFQGVAPEIHGAGNKWNRLACTPGPEDGYCPCVE